ncbi:hypothetical protein FIM1_4664 [Kluyveromyces marxianus]|uniref:Uncharacterized protein n=1 Tax=Kluyveromyces marxianus TaxID=4911 RepID=A0ABX6F4M5_KLUMA|nr:hypothetical protein FIM1_4664 [Kluyveromyces marxianus]
MENRCGEWVNVTQEDVIESSLRYFGNDATGEHRYANRRHILFPPIATCHFDPRSPHYIPLYHDDIIKYEKQGLFTGL